MYRILIINKHYLSETKIFEETEALYDAITILKKLYTSFVDGCEKMENWVSFADQTCGFVSGNYYYLIVEKV